MPPWVTESAIAHFASLSMVLCSHGLCTRHPHSCAREPSGLSRTCTSVAIAPPSGSPCHLGTGQVGNTSLPPASGPAGSFPSTHGLRSPTNKHTHSAPHSPCSTTAPVAPAHGRPRCHGHPEWCPTPPLLLSSSTAQGMVKGPGDGPSSSVREVLAFRFLAGAPKS